MMRASRLAYNDAVQLNERQELLLNIVRLRYHESKESEIKTFGITKPYRQQMARVLEGREMLRHGHFCYPS
jgi:hypothetical protein